MCKIKIYFATWLEVNQGHTLNKAGADRRLMSFYFIAPANNPDYVKEYVKKGVVDGKSKSKDG